MAVNTCRRRTARTPVPQPLPGKLPSGPGLRGQPPGAGRRRARRRRGGLHDRVAAARGHSAARETGSGSTERRAGSSPGVTEATSRVRNLLGRLAAEHYLVPPPISPGDPVQEQVLEALRELKPAEREALLLVHWEELSYAEAAQTLGCSANAVGIRVHKAKARLRVLFDTQTADRWPSPAISQPRGTTHGS